MTAIRDLSVSSSQQEVRDSKFQSRSAACQRILLVAAIACRVLTAIPPLRLAGSIASRVVTVLNSGVSFARGYNADSNLRRFLNGVRIGVVIVALVATAIALPLLMIVSLGVDAGMQIAHIARALTGENKDPLRALFNFGILLIDILSMTSLILGSWQLMIAAIAFNLLAMAVIAAIAKKRGQSFEATCYLLIVGLSSANSINVGSSVSYVGPRNWTFSEGSAKPFVKTSTSGLYPRSA